jgi:hypothetical protein
LKISSTCRLVNIGGSALYRSRNGSKVKQFTFHPLSHPSNILFCMNALSRASVRPRFHLWSVRSRLQRPIRCSGEIADRTKYKEVYILSTQPSLQTIQLYMDQPFLQKLYTFMSILSLLSKIPQKALRKYLTDTVQVVAAMQLTTPCEVTLGHFSPRTFSPLKHSAYCA